jgi:hypothetical protein
MILTCLLNTVHTYHYYSSRCFAPTFGIPQGFNFVVLCIFCYFYICDVISGEKKSALLLVICPIVDQNLAIMIIITILSL